MRYTSTRDDTVNASFSEALFGGYAPDGGLYVPQSIPQLPDLSQLVHLTYPELMVTILRLYIDECEIDDRDLRTICDKALVGFDTPEEAVQIRTFRALPMMHVSELFHGPTFCFKDLGMRLVMELLDYFGCKLQKKISLIVSTTGDTGPAAAHAVQSTSHLQLVVHYPQHQISDFQRRQLTTLEQSENLIVVAFQGDGDDMDLPIKNLLLDSSAQLSNNRLWTGVNSYNIGRPVCQIIHWIWTYLRIQGATNRPLDVIVPTGAMGNVVSGYLAMQMGVPIQRFVLGVNVNDISHRVVQTGAFHKSDSMKETLSEAINIQVPYNFERLLYYLSDQDCAVVKQHYAKFQKTGKMDIRDGLLEKLQAKFGSARVTDEQLCRATRKMYGDYDYLIDPHTAVAVSAADQLGYLAPDNEKTFVILATASPVKFQHAVTSATDAKTWDNYVDSEQFRASARKIMSAPERPPIVYKREGTMEESQAVWEAQTRELVHQLERRPTK